MPVKNQKGFTLLELLIVLLTIGVLAGIAIPQFAMYRSKTKISSVTSGCRSLYRLFTVFYLENEAMYPSNAGDGNTDDFNTTTFFPLSDSNFLGGLKLEIDMNTFKTKLGGNPANRVYFADDTADYQNYYLVLPWGENSGVKFIVASSADVTDDGGNLIDGGNYLDGVFVWQDGALKF